MQSHIEDFRSLLSAELKRRKQLNAVYSLRSFARHLEISPSHLSLLMSGKKRLTPKLASQIASRLSLSAEETLQLLSEAIPELRFVERAPTPEQLLSEDEFRLITNWYHFAILSLSKTKQQRSADPKKVSRALGIDPLQAADAIARLKRLGLLQVKNGNLHQTSKPLNTTTDIPSSAIRSYHRQNLQLAETKLESVSVEKREFSTITMAIDSRKLKKAKKMINDFKKRLCDELETSAADEVYTLAIQLFPLTDNTMENK